MSKKGRRPRTDPPAQEREIWVKTEPDIEGTTFVVTVEVTEDIAFVLNRETALTYAAYCQEAAALAEYDAAVLAQLTSRMGEDAQDSLIRLIADMRAERPPQQHDWPLRLIPGVSQRTRGGFVRLMAGEEEIGQWSPKAARRHASHAIEAVTVADLDAGYLRMLRGSIGLPEATARNVVDDLANYRIE